MKVRAKLVETTREEDKWRIESDARKIEEYAELKGDKTRFDRAMKYLEEKQTKINKVIENTK